jgi:hypothetical protein
MLLRNRRCSGIVLVMHSDLLIQGESGRRERRRARRPGKLSEMDVRHIRALAAAAPVPQAKLAKLYGVDASTISRLLRGRTNG